MKSNNRLLHFNLYSAIALILSIFFTFGNPLLAAEKSIVVVEKSANADDKTNHGDNGTNLPAGATAVEASSLADAAAKVLAELGPGDCIKNLHFRGHGSPGNQSVGDGVNHDDAKRVNGAGNWEAALAGLQGKFCPGATIHLWGCNVGSCTLGANKLKEIADFFGVTVRGAVNKVDAGGQTTYAGPVQEATPANPAPACIPPTDDKAVPAVPKKDADCVMNTGIPLNAVIANPNAVTLNLNMGNVMNYIENINFPSCPPANTTLVNLGMVMTFSNHPNPNLISFYINNLSATLQPFNFCGNPTGMNQYTLTDNYLAQGTIHKFSGQIVGSITYLQSNDLGSQIMTNDIRGDWAPGGPMLHLQLFSSTSSASSLFIPTLPEWGLILLALLLLTAGAFYLKRRLSF